MTHWTGVCVDLADGFEWHCPAPKCRSAARRKGEGYPGTRLIDESPAVLLKRDLACVRCGKTVGETEREFAEEVAAWSLTSRQPGGFFVPKVLRGRRGGPGPRPKARRPVLGRVINPRSVRRLITAFAPVAEADTGATGMDGTHRIALRGRR